MLLERLHHVTCVCRDAQRTTDFYRDTLGFSLVKKTVNFDDPHSYHLYFGDQLGSAGSLITFLEWPRADPGRLGRGTLESIGLVSPLVSAYEEAEDPDGLRLRLYGGPAPSIRDVVILGNADLYAGLISGGAPVRFGEPVEETALIGPGVTHHFAWEVLDATEQTAWVERLAEIGLPPSAQQDQIYFRSIYFRMPDGVLVEIATSGPGFLVDEAPARLGSSLSLPSWLEAQRETLERELAPIR